MFEFFSLHLTRNNFWYLSERYYLHSSSVFHQNVVYYYSLWISFLRNKICWLQLYYFNWGCEFWKKIIVWMVNLIFLHLRGKRVVSSAVWTIGILNTTQNQSYFSSGLFKNYGVSEKRKMFKLTSKVFNFSPQTWSWISLTSRKLKA